MFTIAISRFFFSNEGFNPRLIIFPMYLIHSRFSSKVTLEKVHELLQHFGHTFINYTSPYRRAAHLDLFVQFYEEHQNYNMSQGTTQRVCTSQVICPSCLTQNTIPWSLGVHRTMPVLYSTIIFHTCLTLPSLHWQSTLNVF